MFFEFKYFCKFGVEEFENMVPFEADIYLKMYEEQKKKESEEMEQNAKDGGAMGMMFAMMMSNRN